MKKSLGGGILEGPLLSSVIAYTVPIILSSILQLLFNAADLVVVGRFCGSASVAAVGATGSITGLLVNFFIGLSVGTGVGVAQSIGAKDTDNVHRIIHTSIPTALICGVVLSFVGFIFSADLLGMMGTPQEVLPLSALYMQIYFCGVVFVMLYNFAASILRASGDTKSPLVALVLAGILNVILNLIFVTCLHMNVAGVALATTISQVVSATIVIITLMRREDACRLIPKKMRIYKKQLLQIIRIGLPAGIQNSLFGISNVLIQSSINSFGPVFLSGSSAAINIEGFIYVVMNAFHQTALNFIGQNMGAKNYDRIKKISRVCLASVFVAGIICGLLVNVFGRQLLSIYITDSPEAITYGMLRLAMVSLPYFLCGILDVTNGALRGIGASLVPMLVSVVGVCGFRIIWVTTIFNYFHTPECLLSSYIISWTLTAAVEIVMFYVLLRKKSRNRLS